MERRGARGEGGVEERGGGRPRDEKVGDGSVRMRMVMVAVIVGAVVASEYKDTAATLSKYLWKEGRGRERERETMMISCKFHQYKCNLMCYCTIIFFCP